jgi:AraC-like DNA-binding protein
VTLPINIPGKELGCQNAVLAGTAARYHVPDFEGCLSLKSVMRGAAVWEAGGRAFVVNEDRYVILNDRQHYTLTIESRQKATTFCLFFQRGFVEDVYRTLTCAHEALLDLPHPAEVSPLEFFNCLEPHDGAVLALLRQFHFGLQSSPMTKAEWDHRFLTIAENLVRERRETERAIAGIPAMRASTRVEVYRRLLRGRDFLLASLTEPVRLNEMAAAACLSSYHFHRSFAQIFHETPHQCLTRHRLDHAAHLLRHTDLNVTEIGLECSFESPASFSALFRRRYGVSPRQYRRAI